MQKEDDFESDDEDQPNLYAILGISNTATLEEVVSI